MCVRFFWSLRCDLTGLSSTTLKIECPRISVKAGVAAAQG
jgi:hypothetical protein